MCSIFSFPDRKKIFSRYPIPIVPAASLLFTLFPSPSRMTAFWSFAHEFRSRLVVCARVCASGTGGILISIQSRTISLAQPLKDEGFSVPSQHAHDAGRLGKCCNFRMFAEALGKLCKPVAIPTICRVCSETRKGGDGKREGSREESKRSAVSDRRQH